MHTFGLPPTQVPDWHVSVCVHALPSLHTVPFGTGNRLDGGEVIEIMPQTLQVKVGESIRINNDDIRDFMIGPFFVAGGQTLAMRFTHPGRLSGICLVNPEGEFVIEVTE